MSDFCVAVNLPDPCTKPISEYGTSPHVFIPVTDISTTFMDVLYAHDLDLHLAELFYNPPKRISTIHIDALGGDYSKINFVYGGEKSLMCWYSVNPGVAPKQNIDYTAINTRSYNYTLDEVTLAYRTTIHSPSIVQVGIPHNIVNAFKERWCLSLVPVRRDTRKRLTLKETVEIFKDFTLGNL